MLTAENDLCTKSDETHELEAFPTDCFASVPVPPRKYAIPFVLEQETLACLDTPLVAQFYLFKAVDCKPVLLHHGLNLSRQGTQQLPSFFVVFVR